MVKLQLLNVSKPASFSDATAKFARVAVKQTFVTTVFPRVLLTAPPFRE